MRQPWFVPLAPAVLVLAWTALANPAIAQSSAAGPTPTAAPGAQEVVHVTAVHVLVRPRTADGAAVLDLRPDELRVTEDGVPVRILALEPLAGAVPAASSLTAPEASSVAEPGATPASGKGLARPTEAAPTRVAVYIIPAFCRRGELTRVVEAIRSHAAELYALGPVSVVVADPEPKVVASGLTTATALDAALLKLPKKADARSRLEDVRRSFATDISGMKQLDLKKADGDGAPAPSSTFKSQVSRARLALAEERSAVQSAFARLVTWARDGEAGAGFLFLAVDGFDLDPAEFYLWTLESAATNNAVELQQAAVQFRNTSLRPVVENAAASIAERGWSILTFDTGQAAQGLGSKGAESSSREVFRSFVGDRSGLIQGQPEARAGTIKATPDLSFLKPREPLAAVAEVTGGAVLRAGEGLHDRLADLGNSLLLVYQVERPADGRSHAVAVSASRPGVTVAAPKQVFSGTAEGESEVRARRVLAGGERPKDFPVKVSILPKASLEKGRGAGTLSVRARLGELRDVLATLGVARLRVTVAVEVDGAPEAFVAHEVKETTIGTGDDWVYEAPIMWPLAARRVAVLIEELGTGITGGGLAPFPAARGETKRRGEDETGEIDASVH